MNLPPDAETQFGNPIRKVASYQWIEDAVDDAPTPDGGWPPLCSHTPEFWQRSFDSVVCQPGWMNLSAVSCSQDHRSHEDQLLFSAAEGVVGGGQQSESSPLFFWVERPMSTLGL